MEGAGEMYNYLLFVHVMGAIIWVGGDVALQVIGTRISRADDPVQLAKFAGQVEWLGTRVLTPSAVVILIAGVFMVLDAWSFELLWVVIGLAGFSYSLVTGAVLLGPLSGKTGKLIEERGAEDPEVQGNIRKLFMYSRIELGILIVVVFAMTVKPTL
ncbi:MAG: DUF2269 family protein [Actinobacteria bacterium]|jgi:uncharacterized membrane protein|nr:DUF2269 family protein [Actinomycetota bacterium]